MPRHNEKKERGTANRLKVHLKVLHLRFQERVLWPFFITIRPLAGLAAGGRVHFIGLGHSCITFGSALNQSIARVFRVRELAGRSSSSSELHR